RDPDRHPDGDPHDLEVVFSELSPRPHDTGLVTLLGQNLSEFELHLRAVLGERQLAAAQAMARTVTDALGGAGLFGVEFFLCGELGAEEVVFSELSPRPHDTGLVTLVGQNLSEFELHLRAVLGLPIPEIRSMGPAASRVILADEAGQPVRYEGVAQALEQPESQVLLFGKEEARPGRRLGVALARGADLSEARARADNAAAAVRVRTGR
ncbi:MAG: ATP-grasp domain-containing protein, partial [Cyanobium sp.]